MRTSIYRKALKLTAIIMMGITVMTGCSEALDTGVHSSAKSIVTTISGDARTSRSFTWHTEPAAADAVIQVVEGAWKKDLDENHILTVKGNTTTITTEKNVQQGVHKVDVTGLKAGTAYSYRVGSGDGHGWSEPAQFVTEPEAAEAFTFLNVTDSQGITEADFKLWGHTLDQAFQLLPDARFIVHNGDLTEFPGIESGWDHFFEKGEQWLTRIPLMPVTGNHEEIDNDAERFVSHFRVPDNGADGSIPGTTYSFDYGNAHFVVLNTESNIEGQTEWLREDLARTDKPWIIAAMHRGAYGGSSYKKVKKWVEVFDEFKVDLVLQGHNHEYSRSYPLRGGEVVGDGESAVTGKQGTVYVVANTSGPKFNEKKGDKFYHKVHFQNSQQMFAGITIDGDTLSYKAYNVDGELLDKFELKH
ncbi:metallophosphoesterase family protein [Paenibacillus oenotherae]|uniref:Metallophosphoesterase family protein n=1 Tax=Paenibacillus oenotherae TaxID=1435645 RepID=A0ABS7DBJ4_9BACL|nr:metallophosphoesterase family protein [Paenibacillus oenotherae]MBW7477271.1 metallophosphoesterase family protein [Paenibacillus oenotherae]